MKTSCPKKALLLWQLRIALAGGLLTAASAFAAMFSRWVLIIPAVAVVGLIFLIFWYLPRFFKSCELVFQNGAITVSRGVFVRTTHIMPYAGLVYAQSFSTPLSKRLGLTCLTLKAARSHLILPELTVEDAEDLMKLLSKEGAP